MIKLISLVTGVGLLVLSSLASTGANAEGRQGPKSFVVALQGTAAAEPRTFDGVDYLCFDVDLVDPATGRYIGPASDCLNPASILPIGVDGGFGVNNLTFVGLPGGTVVSLSRTTVQPVEDSSHGPTHITGEVASYSNIVTTLNTGRFMNATGNTRLSGQVDMSQFGSGIITFDCLFIVSID